VTGRVTRDRPADASPLVAFRNVGKTYANGTMALRGVSFEIAAGSCHAICGENGAGKSTLMKCLFGLEAPTEGVIEIDGRPIGHDHDPSSAGAAGIGMVHQHFSLVPSFTVAENLALAREPTRFGLLDHAASRRETRHLSARFGLTVDPDARVGSLSVAAQQKVEILKSLARNIRLLILDEPTAVLTPQETAQLFEHLRGLLAAGLTIVFISHKLREVRAFAERVTVLRGGRLTGDASVAQLDASEIARLVMGEELRAARHERTALGPEVLRVERLSLAARDPADCLWDVSFTLRSGEILGIAGVEGSGQRGLVSALCGRVTPSSGEGSFVGRNIERMNAAAWRAAGLAHIPADRYGNGAARTLSLADNAVGGLYRGSWLGRRLFLPRARAEARAAAFIRAFDVRAAGPKQLLGALSGGNAQKLISARELADDPRLVIADQPTRGIDVRSAALIRDRLTALAARGAAILLITADLDELLSLADRIIILFSGRIAACIENTGSLAPEDLGPYMLGLEKAA
jgi:general nucleoside transport system ATP-binding protein